MSPLKKQNNPHQESINRVERLTKPTMFWRMPGVSKAKPEHRLQATSRGASGLTTLHKHAIFMALMISGGFYFLGGSVCSVLQWKRSAG
jgi:hypothetical protein